MSMQQGCIHDEFSRNLLHAKAITNIEKI